MTRPRTRPYKCKRKRALVTGEMSNFHFPVQELERKHVDGCAIFWRTAKFSLLKEHLVEFNQVRI